MMSQLVRLHLAFVHRVGDREERGSAELSVTAILTAVMAVTAVTLGGLFSDAILDKAREIVRLLTQ